ncbi:probable N-acetylglucosaminyl-phosphatidylinositol de-N-acetylase isoform X2 [Prosopis cineraria]|uniref:probable N-acetylglucosaminyl-phosphatidylinositol de-N-acetylase isoform X2 n=1 Tax=Prosopis cineraria TaxID=364024 RepID=UPI00240FFD52|nr:probable N-acetylglucosaminyl-phosphatidylinositol de-N-acetylase isoform X2 [Prosopis cineraria]XP_054785668.1 probable N-acetylglucosaminyl-phosphatidylinositol de-N-acetylase isoform X2 [Prosopis cineraria]XP_054785669.1 probable N-acetylglucosaminyl-phosphatidylinositol de-N-acetylase isoform X2 [Prosopis cineraria]
MAWILATGCLLVLWIISLCKVLLVAHVNKRNSFKKNGKALTKRSVLIVVAHPDDESMFFTPTINYLTSRGHYIHILCLSIGDADCKGSIRERELFQACATLKVPTQQVRVVDHPDLQDGFGKVWNHNLVTSLVMEEISTYNIDMIITFDNYGVSGHCNHRDVHYGVCKLLHDIQYKDIEAWELVSTNILRKYSGPIDVWLAMFASMLHSNETIQFLVSQVFCSHVELYIYEHTQKDQVKLQHRK